MTGLLFCAVSVPDPMDAMAGRSVPALWDYIVREKKQKPGKYFFKQ